MKDFADIASFLAHMSGVAARAVVAGHAGVERAAEAIEAEARREIGTYQDEAPPFGAWPELADYTKADRVARGYTANDPGLRSGEMRDSIGHVVQGETAAVGSSDDKLVWFELGTVNQPPRSVLGMAAVHETDRTVDGIASAVVRVIAGAAK